MRPHFCKQVAHIKQHERLHQAWRGDGAGADHAACDDGPCARRAQHWKARHGALVEPCGASATASVVAHSRGGGRGFMQAPGACYARDPLPSNAQHMHSLPYEQEGSPSPWMGAGQKKQKDWQCSTEASHVIPQRTTSSAQASLASEIGREPAYSHWFDRTTKKYYFQHNILLR